MFSLPVLIAALALLIVAFFVTILLWFLAVRTVFMPWRTYYGHNEAIIFLEARNVAYYAVDSTADLAEGSVRSVTESFQLVWNYAFVLLISAIVAAAGTAILIHHKEMIEAYHVLSQCGIAPIRDKLVMNVVNFLALLYDMVAPFWTIGNRMWSFIQFGWIPIVLGCTDTSIFGRALVELGYGLLALIKSPIEILTADNPLEERIDITPALYHFGRVVKLLNEPLHCFCEFFDFLWEPSLRVPSYVSIHVTADCAVNTPVRLVQAFLKPFVGHTFALAPLADEMGCVLLSYSDVQQAGVLESVQVFTGVFSEVSTPCETFDGNAHTCSAIGRCFFDVLKNKCRTLGRCDAYGSRTSCNADPICCYSSAVNRTSHKVSFACAEEGLGQCPVGTSGCSSLATPQSCLALNGTCLWDGVSNTCVNHGSVCAGLQGDDCKFTQSYCGAFSLANCAAYSNGLCTVSGGQCVSYAKLCYDDPLLAAPDRNRTCASFQLCGWNETRIRNVALNTTTNTTYYVVNETVTGTCLTRDVNDTVRVAVNASAAAAQRGVQMALNIPGADAPPDTIGKLLGVPILLALLELQWAHSGFLSEPLVGIMRIIVMVIDNIADAKTTFGSYEGVAKWRVGNIFDYMRSWLFPVAQVGVVLDANLPCSLQSLLQILPDVGQGIAELFFLLIYFSVFQPTGPANVVNAWLPLDFVSSYYNDTRVSFMPLVFINNTVWQLERVNATYFRRCVVNGQEFGKRSRPCKPLAGDYYDIDVDVNLGLIYLRPNASTTNVYNWDNVSLSGTEVRRVYIFPGMDRTIPRIIRNIQQSSVCIERVVGDGTNFTENTAPWACFIRHLINVLAELLNVILQLVAYSADIIRFTDDPIYRHTALDVSFEGIFAEWAAATHCLGNMIRLGDPQGAGIYGVCTSFDSSLKSDGTYEQDRSSVLCCLASLVEAVLNGALLVTLNEILLFVRDFMGIKFKGPGIQTPHIPDLNRILAEIEVLIDKLACVIASFIPDTWRCNMVLQFEDIDSVDTSVDCRVISELGRQVPCGYMKCKRGNECVAKFLSAAIRFVLLVIPRAFNLVYSTIRRLILKGVDANNECIQLNSRTLCENNGCQWKISPTGVSCVLPASQATTNSAGALQTIVEMLTSLLTILATGSFAAIERLALVFDCIRCASLAAQSSNPAAYVCRQGNGLTDSTSGTPFYDFVVFLLAPMLNIISAVVKMVVTIAIFVIVIIVIFITGQFGALETMFDAFGDTLEKTVNQIAQNVVIVVVKALGLEEVYNGLVTIINGVVLEGCHFINDFCDALSLDCGLTCPPPLKSIPLGSSDSYPAVNCGDFNFDSESCNAWGVQCIYEDATSTCRKRVGCELGLERDLCAAVQGCIWRTTTNRTLTGGRNVRAKECVNVSAIGMNNLAASYATVRASALPHVFSFEEAPCAGLNDTVCTTHPECAYDTDEQFCYHRKHAQVCERFPGNQTLRGVVSMSDARGIFSMPLDAITVCSGLYEPGINGSMGGTSLETCTPKTVTINGSVGGSYTICARTLTNPCNLYNTSSECGAWSGLCYWSESLSMCMSGRDLCMSHESDPETCAQMTNLCGFADGNQATCNTLPELRDLCRYDAVRNKCVSRAYYCARNESNIQCGPFFSCVWDPQGLSQVDVPPTGSAYSFPKPRCVTVDMIERIARKPSLLTNRILSNVISPFYQRSKRATMDRDVLKRVAATEALTNMTWPAGDPCLKVMQVNGQSATARVDAIFGGSFDAFGEYMYCFGRQLWTIQSQPFSANDETSIDPSLLRSLGATGTLSYPGQTSFADKMTQGECDVLYGEYYNASQPMPWSDLRPLERATLVECTKQRVYGMYLRQLAGYTWLPEDLIDNPYRKYVLLLQAFRAIRVYNAYKERFAVMPETLLDPQYAQRLSAQNLATLDLAGLQSVDDVKAMLERVSLVDYFVYNGLGAREAKMAEDLHTLFGNTLSGIGNSLSSVFGRVPFNTSHVTLGDLFANGTSTTLSQVAVTSLSSSFSAFVTATNTSFSLASDPLTYKRALHASVAMGRLMYDATMTALVWMGRVNATDTKLGDGVSPVDDPPFNSTSEATGSEPAASTSSFMDTFKNTMGNRFGVRLAAARDMLWRNPDAAVRREKLSVFGENLMFTMRAQLVIPLMTKTAEERRIAYTALRNVTRPVILSYQRTRASFAERYNTTLGGLLDPVECLTNSNGFVSIGTDWFCDNCIYGDNFLGHLIALVLWMVRYFRGAPEDGLLVNFPNSFERFKNYSKYVSDDTARVRVGDSYENPMRFPYRTRSNLHVLGDTTPNKLRLYDYESLFVELFESIKLGITEPSSVEVIALFDRGLNALWVRASGGVWTASVNAAYYTGIVSNDTRVSLTTQTPEWRDVKLTAVRPVGTILGVIASRLFAQLVTCSVPVHGEDGEIDGSRQRFAIGEILGIGVIVVVVIIVPLMFLFPNSFMSLSATTGIVLMAMVVLFLSFTYNWSLMCAPALPQPLGDQTRDFLGFTLMPKCNVYHSGTFIGEYNATNCYSCENARAVRSIHCVRDLNITSIYDDLALIAVMHFPELPETMRDLGLGSLIDKHTTFGERFAKFNASLDRDSDESHSQHSACIVWTGVPYLALLQFAALLFIMGAPILFFAIRAAVTLYKLLYRMMSAQLLVYNYMQYISDMYPYMETYGSTPEDDALASSFPPDDDDDDGGDDANTSATDSSTSTAFQERPSAYSALRHAVTDNTFGLAYATLRRRFAATPPPPPHLPVQEWPLQQVRVVDHTQRSINLLQGLRGEHDRQGF